MTIAFWMDPIETINPGKDSTYLLIHECIQQELNPVFIKNISSTTEHLRVEAIQFKPFTLGSPLTVKTESIELTEKDIDFTWLRKDPPVNETYIQELLILNRFSQHIHPINHIPGILLNNEKLAATQFPTFTPPTLVSSNKTTIKSFINTHGSTIIKPIDGYGGMGIFKVNESDTNTDTIIELSTNNESKAIICQKAVDHTTGDKRIVLVNGDPIGAVKRINHTGIRNNFMAGGVAEKATITESDQTIINHIKPFLLNEGLFFVGIDIIDNHLIEINVTSPTGLQEINKLDNINCQNIIITAMTQQKEPQNA